MRLEEASLELYQSLIPAAKPLVAVSRCRDSETHWLLARGLELDTLVL